MRGEAPDAASMTVILLNMTLNCELRRLAFARCDNARNPRSRWTTITLA